MRNPKSLTIDDLYKEAILKILERESRLRKYTILGVALIFLVIKIFLLPFPYFYFVSFFCLTGFSLLFLAINHIKTHPLLSAPQIRHILVSTCTLEMILIFVTLYFYMPIVIYHTKTIGITAIPFFCFYIMTTYSLFYSKKYSLYSLFVCLFLVVSLTIIEFKGLYPLYSNYPILEEALGYPKYLRIVIPSTLAGFIFFTTKFIMDYYWERSINTEVELKKMTQGLQKRVEERTKELEEAKTSLEIKVAARTRELKELSEGLERQVKERTKELQERVNELERFRKLTVGRELKMLELKKEVEKLKEELEKAKSKN